MSRVHKIEPDQTEMVKRILQIHDEMPRSWNPDHQVSQKYLDALLAKIQSKTKPHGLWVLTGPDNTLLDPIDGMIWATIDDSLGTKVCSINSFWIRPELRNQSLAPILTEQCILWAKEYGAERLDCSTHSKNSRMRSILEKHQFEEGMVQYSLDLLPKP